MPATPIYGLRYPQQSDPADVPSDMGKLASDVEGALGNATLIGTYLGRPAANAVKAGTVYYATDVLGVFRSNGTAWTLVAQGAPLITSAQMSAAPFTTPYDGQKVALIVANNRVWHLHYNASLSDAYKWQFIGGASLSAFDGSTFNGPVGVWFELAPTVVAPRAGYYSVKVQTTVTNSTAAVQTAYLSASLGGTNASVLTALGYANPQPSTNQTTTALGEVQMASGQQLNTLIYATSGSGGLPLIARGIEILPIRLS